jgi:hypothetical protein
MHHMKLHLGLRPQVEPVTDLLGNSHWTAPADLHTFQYDAKFYFEIEI